MPINPVCAICCAPQATNRADYISISRDAVSIFLSFFLLLNRILCVKRIGKTVKTDDLGPLIFRLGRNESYDSRTPYINLSPANQDHVRFCSASCTAAAGQCIYTHTHVYTHCIITLIKATDERRRALDTHNTRGREQEKNVQWEEERRTRKKKRQFVLKPSVETEQHIHRRCPGSSFFFFFTARYYTYGSIGVRL